MRFRKEAHTYLPSMAQGMRGWAGNGRLGWRFYSHAGEPREVRSMQDMKASADKLRAEAEKADQIARSAPDPLKRELYDRLAIHFRQLAGEIEKVIADRK